MIVHEDLGGLWEKVTVANFKVLFLPLFEAQENQGKSHSRGPVPVSQYQQTYI
jgi:hypothetical protein